MSAPDGDLPVTLADIEKLAREYAAERDGLQEVVDEITEIQRKAARHRMRSIKTRAAKVASCHAELASAIEANPELFVKPRTHTVDGIRFGMRKPPGRIEGDTARAVALIDKRMPQRAVELVRTARTLNRQALKELAARDLARIGLALVDTDDQVSILAVRGDLDTLVAALVKDFGEEQA